MRSSAERSRRRRPATRSRRASLRGSGQGVVGQGPEDRAHVRRRRQSVDRRRASRARRRSRSTRRSRCPASRPSSTARRCSTAPAPPRRRTTSRPRAPSSPKPPPAISDDPFYWYFSAALAIREQDTATAQAAIGKALTLAPSDPTILFEAGHVAAFRRRRGPGAQIIGCAPPATIPTARSARRRAKAAGDAPAPLHR